MTSSAVAARHFHQQTTSHVLKKKKKLHPFIPATVIGYNILILDVQYTIMYNTSEWKWRYSDISKQHTKYRNRGIPNINKCKTMLHNRPIHNDSVIIHTKHKTFLKTPFYIRKKHTNKPRNVDKSQC